MALPPRGDPRRPLHLAASSCRVLGVLGLLGATCAGLPLLAVRRGGLGMAPALLPLAVLGGSGAAWMVLAHHIKRRRFWAVVTALVMASIATLGVLAMWAGMAYVMLSAQPGLMRERTFWIMLAVYGLITLALAQLVYHLARSFPALKIAAPDEARGFDVLPVAVLPSQPPTMGDGDVDGLAR